MGPAPFREVVRQSVHLHVGGNSVPGRGQRGRERMMCSYLFWSRSSRHFAW